MSEPLEIRPFLISALVEMPGKVGHRATVVNSESEDKALGSSLALWQVDGWAVTSYDITECTTVTPSQPK